VPIVLGIVWAALIVAAVTTGAAAAAGLLIPVGVVASVSAVRAVIGGLDRRNGRLARAEGRNVLISGCRYGLAVAAPVVLPLAALGGSLPAIVATALVLIGGAAILLVTGYREGVVFNLRLLAGILGPSVASMAVVLARSQGSNEAVAFIAAMLGYDLAAFIFGTGRGALGGMVGVVAGLMAVAVIAVFTAAAIDPPFSGDRPWIVFGLVGVLAPVGVALLDLVVSGARLPALRRLDSLVLSGPAWVIAVALVLRR
jgi:hypothetical protein